MWNFQGVFLYEPEHAMKFSNLHLCTFKRMLSNILNWVKWVHKNLQDVTKNVFSREKPYRFLDFINRKYFTLILKMKILINYCLSLCLSFSLSLSLSQSLSLSFCLSVSLSLCLCLCLCLCLSFSLSLSLSPFDVWRKKYSNGTIAKQSLDNIIFFLPVSSW